MALQVDSNKERACRSCLDVRPLGEFRKGDTVLLACASCRQQWKDRREYRERMLGVAVDPNEERVCHGCLDVRPLSAFTRGDILLLMCGGCREQWKERMW